MCKVEHLKGHGILFYHGEVVKVKGSSGARTLPETYINIRVLILDDCFMWADKGIIIMSFCLQWSLINGLMGMILLGSQWSTNIYKSVNSGRCSALLITSVVVVLRCLCWIFMHASNFKNRCNLTMKQALDSENLSSLSSDLVKSCAYIIGVLFEAHSG